MAAATWWANGGVDDNQELVDAAAAFGLKVELEEELQTVFEVWPENVSTLNVFLACKDDWKLNGKRKYSAIDKTAMKAIMEMMGVENMKDTFTDLIAMQDAAAEVFGG